MGGLCIAWTCNLLVTAQTVEFQIMFLLVSPDACTAERERGSCMQCTILLEDLYTSLRGYISI